MSLPSIPQGFHQALFAFHIFLGICVYTVAMSWFHDSQNQYINAKEQYNNKRGELIIDSIKSKFDYDLLAAQKINNDSSRLLMSIAGEKYNSTVEKLKVIRENVKLADESKLSWQKSKIFLYIFLILMGVNLMYIHQNFIEENSKLTNSNDLLLYEKRAYKNCQSCARYFSPMLLQGKEKDGTVNKGFCSECYNDGELLNTELTEQYVIDEIKKANPKMKKVEKKVSSMVRWNKNPYVDQYKF